MMDRVTTIPPASIHCNCCNSLSIAHHAGGSLMAVEQRCQEIHRVVGGRKEGRPVLCQPSPHCSLLPLSPSPPPPFAPLAPSPLCPPRVPALRPSLPPPSAPLASPHFAPRSLPPLPPSRPRTPTPHGSLLHPRFFLTVPTTTTATPTAANAPTTSNPGESLLFFPTSKVRL